MTTFSEARSVLVLQHLACEHPGSLRGLLTDAGMTLHTVELDEGEQIPDLVDFDLMVVMGGPMDVWQEDRHSWMIDEKAAIRTWVEILERPYLGVCLGHQLLADALGGEVGRMPQPEIGVCRIDLTAAADGDALFGGLGPVVTGLQWHGAQVLEVPERSVVLATNTACAIQAFRAGPVAWGVQFHMEVGEDTVDEWAAVPAYLRALERCGVTESDLRAAVSHELGAMERTTAAMAGRLIQAVEAGITARNSADTSP